MSKVMSFVDGIQGRWVYLIQKRGPRPMRTSTLGSPVSLPIPSASALVIITRSLLILAVDSGHRVVTGRPSWVVIHLPRAKRQISGPGFSFEEPTCFGMRLMEPKRVEWLDHVNVCSAFASGDISAAIGEDGSVWAWGKSKRGQLGLGRGITEAVILRRVEALAGENNVKVSFGWGHALVQTEDGKLLGWGYSADGRIGKFAEALEALCWTQMQIYL